MNYVVTGAAGFIGSNFVHYLLGRHRDCKVVAVDALTYAGNLKNLEPALADARCSFVHLDVCDAAIADVVRGADAVIHFAAESHVDRSIEEASAFIRTNIDGTWRIAEACRHSRVSRLIQISTDEVYGSLGASGKFTEQTPLDPTSPYAASKAAADLLALSLVKTHSLAAIVTRCSNNYGPYQFPEKFIPLMIAQALENQPLPVYGDGQNVRDWIYVLDHCEALDAVLHTGRVGEIYNIGGGNELKNIDVAQRILQLLGHPASLIHFVGDRPAHDRRYAIDATKIERELGWRPRWSFDRGLEQTVQWYRDHAEWLEEVRSGDYRAYFNRRYAREIGARR